MNDWSEIEDNADTAKPANAYSACYPVIADTLS